MGHRGCRDTLLLKMDHFCALLDQKKNDAACSYLASLRGLLEVQPGTKGTSTVMRMMCNMWCLQGWLEIEMRDLVKAEAYF